MQTLAEIRMLLESRGLSPKKSLGQNFLIDQNLVRKLADAAGVGTGDLVLEIGPGTGVLTEHLLERGCEVVAVELDSALAGLLRERLIDGGPYADRLTLIEGDCLASKRALNVKAVEALGGRAFRLVANLPYGAATPLMITLMADHPECLGQFVTIQREVVDRLLASPGSDAYGAVSVIAALGFERERLATLPPECFWPRPGVTSGMLALRSRPGALDGVDRRKLVDTVQTLFASRRKQIGGVLRRMGAFEVPAGIDPGARVEALSVEQMVSLVEAVG